MAEYVAVVKDRDGCEQITMTARHQLRVLAYCCQCDVVVVVSILNYDPAAASIQTCSMVLKTA